MVITTATQGGHHPVSLRAMCREGNDVNDLYLLLDSLFSHTLMYVELSTSKKLGKPLLDMPLPTNALDLDIQ